MKNKKKKIIVGMSGGVDSSVSAWLLKKQNYLVEGLFMKNWEEDDKDNYCSAKQDLDDVKIVCNKLNIRLHKVNFSNEYWNNVFKIFLKKLKVGNTPNPDVLCNKEIKFKLFFDFSISILGADFIATGHYAQKQKINNRIFLIRSKDLNKDQTYFLYTLNENQMKKIMFPIGHLKKCQVRKIATEKKLHIANKKDSTGICFIGPKKFRKFLSNYIPKKKGKIINTKKEVIGVHDGVLYYTIGQRRGLRIGGIKGKQQGKPWYVVKKEINTNTLVVAEGNKNDYLISIGMIVSDLNWINKTFFFKKDELSCSVQTRHRQKVIPCYLKKLNNTLIKVLFNKLAYSVTSGQSAVFYSSKEECIGGGIIKKIIPLKKIY
ncbi:tRNA-specific 2-thiouridylase MnmA [Buchnera aphidicola (Tetraneura ulmi)]|uniref:tRNA 2-thiouridine(34) synthase MnmA n=1 Tax=Buchnera aphidicola TaxID=9 RepID=UPI003463F249